MDELGTEKSLDQGCKAFKKVVIGASLGRNFAKPEFQIHAFIYWALLYARNNDRYLRYRNESDMTPIFKKVTGDFKQNKGQKWHWNLTSKQVNEVGDIICFIL